MTDERTEQFLAALEKAVLACLQNHPDKVQESSSNQE
jgi:hypothetical protein